MSRKVLCYWLGLLLAGLLGASWASAQPGSEPAAGTFQNKFQELQRSQIGPAVGVDQRIVDKLLQIEQRYTPQRQQLIEASKNEFRRLQQVMSQPNPSDQEVSAILANIKHHQQEINNLKQRQDQEEMAILTPVQQARYIIYKMNLVKEARSIKSGPTGPGGPGRAGPTVPMTPQAPTGVPVYRPTQ